MLFEFEAAHRAILDSSSILVVDDIQDNLDLMEALLVDDGYDQVICAQSGRECLEVMSSECVSLVLLDIMMPEMDGYQVLEAITANPDWRHVPVIMVTGGALRQSEALEKSFRLGAVDYISKPVNEIELSWRIRSSLMLYCERMAVRRQTEVIQASEEKFRALFENTMDECALIDPLELTVLKVNRSLVSNAGTVEPGTPFDEIYPHAQRAVEQRALAMLEENGFVHYESTRQHDNGGIYPVDVQITRVRYDDHETLFMVQRDITERKRNEERMRALTEQLDFLAAHDPLTGLPNRREFEKLLIQAISTANLEDQIHTLCYIDLDQFKIINDTSGHMHGDTVLCVVSELLRKQIRQADTLARLGGDEFGLLLQGCDIDNAHRIVEQMRTQLANHVFDLDGISSRISASFGLVSIESGGGSNNELMAAADAACYAAKDLGRNRIHVFTQEDSILNERRRAMEWVNGINKALEENRFSLFCQPILSLQDESQPNPRHWELLLRITDENGGLISPGEFIVAAERYHIMPAIDRWVLPKSFELIEEFLANCEGGNCGYVFSLNLSGAALGDERTLDLIRTELAKRKIPNDVLCFEITETAVIQNMEQAIEFIGELRGMGCKFSMDDFGRGSSNFANLRSMPLDFIKIDGSFVRNIVDDELSRSIVQSIRNASHILGIQCVAEFVEDDEILELVRDLGVDYAQGYSIARPGPMLDLIESIKA